MSDLADFRIKIPRDLKSWTDQNEIAEWCRDSLGYWVTPKRHDSHKTVTYIDGCESRDYSSTRPDPYWYIYVREEDASLFILRWC